MLDRLPDVEVDPRRTGEQLHDVLKEAVVAPQPGEQLPSTSGWRA